MAERPENPHPLVKKVLAPKPPIAKLIGFEVEQISLGHAVAALEAEPQHANPRGTLHGAILCDIADAAMGMAFAPTLSTISRKQVQHALCCVGNSPSNRRCSWITDETGDHKGHLGHLRFQRRVVQKAYIIAFRPGPGEAKELL